MKSWLLCPGQERKEVPAACMLQKEGDTGLECLALTLVGLTSLCGLVIWKPGGAECSHHFEVALGSEMQMQAPCVGPTEKPPRVLPLSAGTWVAKAPASGSLSWETRSTCPADLCMSGREAFLCATGRFWNSMSPWTARSTQTGAHLCPEGTVAS